ncbi:hypothetical protein [Mycolicibacterium diernhoferi]|uniref:Uncharacterized protein n=1 Tax=Mycolicibacterium diernhoferi TaxID=1801 RepID=A0A1Q4H9Y3_9MYCO|nr:hypothetical protein [Mycolicibacterium diernhoferi]OJZ64191.1 hypothetical protein BRW64_19020 [Mycolicibacterium diernhoferi]OPE49075.1 hypothetical protein BV510_22760 [Mycolicibacterium diernhoferi]PEG55203.1 hypothetical protein CRI78_06380 [Mycolicibacterium diernhoferi]QYL21776.1 hypothetical protein K0O62_22730 [Mycolicibacterium diernhoferi]
MEGIGIFILIVVVLIVGSMILEKMVDGVLAGMVAVIKAPFAAATRAREKAKSQTLVHGLQFQTAMSPAVLHDTLASHFAGDDFHPANRVIVQADEPGRFIVDIAWHEDTRFEVEGGPRLKASGTPVVVAELTHSLIGPPTDGRVRLTRFSSNPDWTDEAVLENVMPWMLSPLLQLDPTATVSRAQPSPPRI